MRVSLGKPVREWSHALLVALVFGLSAAACDSTSTAPSPPTATPVPGGGSPPITSASYEVFGRVVDEGGVPVPGATAILMSVPEPISTDPFGRFWVSFTSACAGCVGPYVGVRIWHPAYGSTYGEAKWVPLGTGGYRVNDMTIVMRRRAGGHTGRQ